MSFFEKVYYSRLFHIALDQIDLTGWNKFLDTDIGKRIRAGIFSQIK